MGVLAKSRWFYRGEARVGPVLDNLGIRYRKVRGKTFWEANAHLLGAIYHEFAEEAGERLLDLHPDRTLRATDKEFAEFAEVIAVIKKQFVRNGVHNGVKGQPPNNQIRILPKGASLFERRAHRRKIKREWSRKTYPRRRESALQKSREHYWRNIDAQRKRCRDKQKRFRHEVLPTLSPEKQAAFWEKSRANSAKWTKEHRDRHNELNRRYCARNKAKCTARTRRWRKNNPDKVAIQNRRRRERRKQKALDPACAGD